MGGDARPVLHGGCSVHRMGSGNELCSRTWQYCRTTADLYLSYAWRGCRGLGVAPLPRPCGVASRRKPAVQSWSCSRSDILLSIEVSSRTLRSCPAATPSGPNGLGLVDLTSMLEPPEPQPETDRSSYIDFQVEAFGRRCASFDCRTASFRLQAVSIRERFLRSCRSQVSS